MREGLIVLPLGVDKKTHKRLADLLLAAFGGFTAVEAWGKWRDPVTGVIYDEPVTQYVIAYEPNKDQDDELHAIADWVLANTTELAVYMRYADGNVSIINRT